MLFSHVTQCGQRRGIAVHAEHAVGDHQFAARLSTRQLRGEAVGIVVQVTAEAGTAGKTGINQ